MRRFAGTLVIAGLLLVGCGSDSDSSSPTIVEEGSPGTAAGSDTTRQSGSDTTRRAGSDTTVRSGSGLTEDDLRPLLLTEQEMPAGWVAEPDIEDTDPDEGAPACFQEVRRHTGGSSVPSADAEFSKDPMPFLFESLGYLGDDATQRLEGAFGALDDCDDLELEAADGTMVPGTIAPVDFPSLGDQSRAYRMSFSAQGTTLTFFVVVAQVDEVGVVLGLGTAGEGADTSELELIAEAAVDKVRAGL